VHRAGELQTSLRLEFWSHGQPEKDTVGNKQGLRQRTAIRENYQHNKAARNVKKRYLAAFFVGKKKEYK
jgi:hypothetical protein